MCECAVCAALSDLAKSVDANLSGEYVFCDLCSQHVLRREPHQAACGLPCADGKVYLDDEVLHDQDCPRCL